jgi:type III pantothenate kinase
MILALDVGNSQIFGGVFHNRELTIRFRKQSRLSTSSDELGLFLRSVLRENGGDPASVEQIAVCSVVPEIIYSLRSCCRKYFGLDPFILQAGAKTGLKIRYRNPLEVGPDRIANAIAATHLYPNSNVIIVDFGTATTFDAVSADRDFLGGIIVPGIRISMEALEKNTARLPNVGDRAARRADRPLDGRVHPVGALFRQPCRRPGPRHDASIPRVQIGIYERGH